jgi:NAD(P)-dependent dehydrogenase (short-subunit alcohol dehydrogenase family)
MPTILITGSNRGIGLAFAENRAEAGWRVIATCRNPARADALRRLKGDVRVHALDLADDGAIDALARALDSEPIDILVNNAGVSETSGQQFGSIDVAAWERAFRVNAIAPLMMAEAFADRIAASERRLIVCMTSRMGSIAEAPGGYYAYRTSKAALNMAARNLARDVKRRGISVVLFHPGWVRTDMGGAQAPMTPGDSVERMWRVIEKFGAGDSGRFLDCDGAEMPW